jgi:NADH-quinone oxidoreductase subunit M
LIGFPSEFLIFKGVFPLTWWAATLAVIGLLITAVWMLMVVQRVFSGPLSSQWRGMPDLTIAERWLLAPVILAIFAVGLYPQLIAGVLQGTVMRFVGQVRF